MRQLAALSPLVLALAAIPSARAFAAEPLKLYDDFKSGTVNPALWADAERLRVVKNGALHLMQRTYGRTDSDSGLTVSSWAESVANPQAVTELRARVKVNALEANSCPANPSAGVSRARIVGDFFNVGIPTPGSMVGDVVAQVRLVRSATSSDPAGVLQVEGILTQCANADCTTSIGMSSVVPLGTVSIGQPAVLEMHWDKPAKTFYFARDKGAYQGTVAYATSDASPPGLPFMQLSTRTEVPSCQSAARVSGLVEAIFDNVFVNSSAAP